jgi:ubiquitin C-terminal hydrolase
MKNNDNDIIKKIKQQKEDLMHWENNLTSNLSKMAYKKDNLYLVQEDWLKKYRKEILDIEINDKNKDKLIKKYKEYKDFNYKKLIDIYNATKKQFKKFPKVSVLNANTVNSIQKGTGGIKCVSTFCNNLLLITLLRNNHCYCFFFFDKNNQLRHGYIKIYNEIFENDYINKLQDKNIDFILGYKNEIKNCQYIKNGKLEITDEQLKIKIKNKFKFLIFSNKNEENNFTNIINKEKEKEEKQKANIIVINPNALKQINKNINENNKQIKQNKENNKQTNENKKQNIQNNKQNNENNKQANQNNKQNEKTSNQNKNENNKQSNQNEKQKEEKNNQNKNGINKQNENNKKNENKNQTNKNNKQNEEKNIQNIKQTNQNNRQNNEKNKQNNNQINMQINKQINLNSQEEFIKITKALESMDNTMNRRGGRLLTTANFFFDANEKMKEKEEKEVKRDQFNGELKLKGYKASKYKKNYLPTKSKSYSPKKRGKHAENMLKEEKNEYLIQPKTKIAIKPKEEYIPGLIGLLNIGATCYMNATLQNFSNIMPFRMQLLDKKIYSDLEKNKEKKKLSFALAEVLSNLWGKSKTKKSYYAPNAFKELISKMNPLFKGIAANDPKDLILFLLETMHKELNDPKCISMSVNDKVPDPRDFNAVYNDFISFYSSKNQSIISDQFYGVSNNMITCGSCSTTTHNVQIINIFFMPLEEVRKFMGYNFNCVRINDCFEYYEKLDILPDYYCNYCRQSYQVYSRNKMIYAPKTLIINLNRGRGIEYNVNIIFEEYLNIRKFVFSPESPFYYELTGVVCHFGSNDMGGHFIAFCKNCNTCEWYKFNDQMVTKCSFNDVARSGMPYVLFYSYVQV